MPANARIHQKPYLAKKMFLERNGITWTRGNDANDMLFLREDNQEGAAQRWLCF